MAFFKAWDTGDIVKSDNYDGSTSYTHLEGYAASDRVNKSDLNRINRNLYENLNGDHNFTRNWAYNTSMKKGVVKDGLISEFMFSGDSDVFKVATYHAGTGDSRYYARLRPGIAQVNSQIAVNMPQTHIAERQLERIFNLEYWGVEDVSITYNYTYDKYQARIKRKNINGVVINHDFVNGGTWETSTDGYDSGLQLLEAIYGDSVFNKQLYDAIGDSLDRIVLETQKQVVNGDTIWWKVNSSGNFIGDSVAGDSIELELWHFTVSGDSTSLEVDDRTYIQWYNDFGQYLYLNVPQAWGDTNTDTLGYPYGDTNVNYSHVTNQNSLITFLRKSTGDTQDNGVFGWHEGNIPDIDKTRNQRFFLNKDLVVLWGNSTDSSGDTLGASWASIKEMSGDSWVFYGNKVFEDGTHKFLSVSTDTDSFKVDTLGGVDIDADNGITLNENSGGVFSIDNNGAITLTSASNQDIDITAQGSGNITIDAAGDSINLVAATLSETFTTYNMSATDVIFTTGDTFAINSTGGIYLIENSGGRIDIEPAGAINLNTPNEQDLSITAGATASDTDLLLTAQGDVIITATGDSIQFNAAIIDYNLTDDFDLDATNRIDLNAGDSSVNALRLYASHTTGGIDIDGNSIDIDGNFINIDASGGSININGSGAISTVTNSGENLTLTATSAIIDINGNELQLDASTFDCNSATVDMDGTSLNATYTSVHSTAISLNATGVGGDIIITANDIVDINGDDITLGASGGSIDINGSGRIDIDANTGQLVDIVSDTEIQINGGSLVDIDGTTITMDGTTLDVNMSLDLDTSGTVNMVASSSSASAIRFYANNATGGIDLEAGSSGINATTTGTITLNPTADLSITGVNTTLNITGNLNIDTDNGINIDENSGGSFSINTSGAVALTSASNQVVAITGTGTTGGDVQLNSGGTADILLDASANEVDITATLVDINAGANGFDLDATSGNITLNTNTSGNIVINSVGNVDIDADTGITLNENSGGAFSINTSGAIAATTASGQNLTLTATSGIVDVNGSELNVDSTTLDINSTTNTFNGTSLSATMSGQVNITSSQAAANAIRIYASNAGGGIDIDSDDITINASGGFMGITTAGRVDIDANTGQLVDITSDTEIQINGGALLDLDATTITMNSSGATTLDAIGAFTINGDAGITLSENSGGSMEISTAGAIVLTSGGNGNVNITSSGSGNINLTSSGDDVVVTASIFDCNATTFDGDGTTFTANYTNIALTGSIDLIGPVNIGNSGANYQMDDNATVSTWAGTATDNGIVVAGSFAAYKVYNAVWNDYAEGFEYSKKETKLIPGLIYKQTEDGLIRTNKRNDKATIGVYSDTAGMVLGSKDCIIPELIGTDEDQSKKTKIPIALAGKVKVYIKEKVDIGDMLVAGKNGFAVKAKFFNKNIIGKALENSNNNKEKRIWMLVK